MENLLFKFIPVWVFLLCFLLGALFIMVFGWAVKSTLAGSDRSGFFGEVAVSVASFPTMVGTVFTEIQSEKDEPIRVLRDEPIRVPRTNTSLSEFSDIKQKPGIGVTGLVIRADRAAIARAFGWRILVGAFVIDGEVKNAALALSPELEIAKVWVLTENAIGGEEPRPVHRKFIHGFDIMSDGSVIFSFDGGISLQRLDYCGSLVWAIGGGFHHAVTLDDREETVWTLHGFEEVVQVSTETGKITRRFSMDDIVAANPALDILEIRKRDENDLGGNSRNTSEEWLNSPFHLNDVDPLPMKLVDRFDGFAAGDLLVSARSLNLIFVVDPDTLEVKWWRIGTVRRQHDPDWAQTGEITVFDNRMSRDYSRILSIAPKSYRTRVLFDGRENDFYSRIRGKHQFTEAGNLIITSSQQGRVFEVDRNGKVILEIINMKPGDDKFNYAVSEALWLPANAFKFGENRSCTN